MGTKFVIETKIEGICNFRSESGFVLGDGREAFWISSSWLAHLCINSNEAAEDAEVIALSPKTLMATNMFICEVSVVIVPEMYIMEHVD
ncbi:hypothetical protein P8452_16136 [Trifolium repens]|nr:hypothetical protein P8452_16136 [Trifolium repens]